jgi:hypothetical protein
MGKGRPAACLTPQRVGPHRQGPRGKGPGELRALEQYLLAVARCYRQQEIDPHHPSALNIGVGEPGRREGEALACA